MPVVFQQIWDLAQDRFALGDFSLHGPSHWRNVERTGLLLAAQNHADQIVVRLFAMLHDCAQKNESFDPQHGQRAADLARELQGQSFQITDLQMKQLCEACAGHHLGDVSTDLTIGTCWDADRLDLPRVGIVPEADRMSTREGQALVAERHPVR